MKNLIFSFFAMTSLLAADPYSYREEEVSFQNPVDHTVLAGTLTLPNKKGPCPAVILLHGSAPLDRDSSMFGHKLFLTWADHLTKQGIAVLRFDKRGAGKSTGDHNKSNLEDYSNDALAGIEYLKNRKDINTKQIGLIGHSEGGMTAVMAARKSSAVSFLVLMAAPCVNFEQIILTQEPALQKIDGIAEEQILRTQKFRKQVFDILKSENNVENREAKLKTLYDEHFSRLSLEEQQIAQNYYGPIEAQIQFFNSAAFRYNFFYNPLSSLKEMSIPILALNGELDFVVSSKQNLFQIERILEEVDHPDYKILELPGLNHAFQSCQTGSMGECAEIKETTSPVALNLMSEWILKKTVKN